MELEQVSRRRSWLGAGDRSLSGSGDSGAGKGSETAEVAKARRRRLWSELRDDVAGPGHGEDGADQTKYDETRYGDGGAGQAGSERAELANARLGDGGTDAGRTIGSQTTPKTFLRCVNYGDRFAFDFEKTAWYFDSHFTRFSAYFLLSHRRPLVLFYFIKLFIATI